MKSKFHIIIFGVIFNSCYHNPVERNKIVFFNDFKEVKNKIFEIQNLLYKFPKSGTIRNTNYYYLNNCLFINNEKVENISNLNIDSLKYLSNFSDSQKIQFVKISKYLKQNYITSAYFDIATNCWHYEYRALNDDNFNDHRELLLIDKNDSIPNIFRVLDRKSNLILVVPKEAIVR